MVHCHSWWLVCALASTMLFGDISNAQTTDARNTIDEIIVTANKRGEQNLHSIAGSIAVIDEGAMEARMLVGMDDYLRTVPGVNYLNYGAGMSAMVIRGISADPYFDLPSVSVYIGDTVLTGLGNLGVTSPDLKLVDVQRVEILRGPQGTLFGDASLGGTVRIIPNSPSTEAFDGNVAASYSSTAEEGGNNYNLQGTINIPLVEYQMAIRATAYHFDNSGYYKNIAASDPLKSAAAALTGGFVRDVDNVGNETYTGGRISLLWEPNEHSKLEFTYLQQTTEQSGAPNKEQTLSSFEQTIYTQFGTQETEILESELSVASLAFEYDFGSVEFISATALANYETFNDQEMDKYFDSPVYLANLTDSESFTQEFRLSSQTDSRFQYLLGLFYQRIDSPVTQLLKWAGDPAADAFGGELIFDATVTYDLTQLSFFGEASYAFTDRLTATVGLRQYDYESGLDTIADGIFNGGPSSDLVLDEANGNTWKANLSYGMNENSLVYAEYSEGFRIGYGLSELPDFCDLDMDGLPDGVGVPEQSSISPDETQNWEAGTKISLADDRVLLRASVYQIDWIGIPVFLLADCGFLVALNAGEAQTKGVEFEGSAAIGDNWRLDFSVGYVDARLTADAPGIGSDGDRLPGTPRYNAKLGVQYNFDIANRYANVRADIGSVGDFYSNIGTDGVKLGDYTTLDLSFTVDVKDISLRFFVNNATNEDALTWSNSFSPITNLFVLRPRTVGLNARYFFGD